MPWNETKPMDQKTQFIADYLKDLFYFNELCERYGISRKTGYKWVERYLRQGPEGLQDRKRTPLVSPRRTDQKIVDALLELRLKHPTWGGKKLLAKLQQQQPRWKLPARSTVYAVLEPYGVIKKQRKRRFPGHPGKSQIQAHAPNDIWCTDFKGQFKMGNGNYCYPLTITDHNSRFLFACQSLSSVAFNGVKPVYTRIFREFGLPWYMRSDNGTPFASTAIGRLSSLSAWWIQLGILHDLIEPGKPQQNGRHERMHRTLKEETTRPAAYSSSPQQRKFNKFLQEFNHERPHETLDMQTPASQHIISNREFPNKIRPFEYPDHFEGRLVSANGGIRWINSRVPVSHIIAGQYIGFEEADYKRWDVYYGPLRVGRFHEEKLRIEDYYGRLKR